ncbi:MAG: hypothetical protein ACQBVK_03735, partial [Candidatus Phytoplasma sp. TWB_XP]
MTLERYISDPFPMTAKKQILLNAFNMNCVTLERYISDPFPMTAKKQILLNAFNMNCVGHINHGLWTHPRDESSAYN